MARTLRPEEARIDLSRLAANFRAIEAFAGRPLMPVVKADAYGHGASRVALFFEALGAPLLTVAFVEEGISLRRAGVKAPIVVMAGAGPEEARDVVDQDLIPVVASRRSFSGALEAARLRPQPLTVHLKMDTGMSRLGFSPGETAAVATRLRDAGLVVDGLMTHLASADDAPGISARQLDSFDAVVTDLHRQGFRPRWIHAANSAGLLHLRPNQTLVRPGLLLYGLAPRPLSPNVAVSPVMTLVGRVEVMRDVAPGTPVSYGGRWVAPGPSRLATVSIGYADGVPRTAAMSDGGAFAIRGRRAPVRGVVCMDFTMVDVTGRGDVEEGDEAVLFGDEPTAWDVADWAGTNAWQVLTSVGLRVPRVYLEDGRVVAVESRY
ncbi:MAG: alanine racemase [Vicinamibacteria bacterium]